MAYVVSGFKAGQLCVKLVLTRLIGDKPQERIYDH